jgi:hypothetical protein
MKRIISTVVLVFLMLYGFSFTQQPNIAQPPVLGNLQGLKIAYMTKGLALTTDEAQRFWPVYYNFNDELNAAKREKKDDIIATDEKILIIKKRYLVEFKKVLGTDERANKVFLCEREFGNFIKKEIENRQRLRALKQNRR